MEGTPQPVTLITGTRTGIGNYLAQYYLEKGHSVIGCSREPAAQSHPAYRHFELDVADEHQVVHLFREIRRIHGRLDILINNAAIASMNHALLTPIETVHRLLLTNVLGTFLFCREAAKLMHEGGGRIVNFVSVAVPLNLEGEAIYTASKAAVVSLTKVLGREFGSLGITVNAIGPNPILTDLVRNVPAEKLDGLVQRQAIQRYGEFRDVSNVVDFFICPLSDFVTGQIIYLGGV